MREWKNSALPAASGTSNCCSATSPRSVNAASCSRAMCPHSCMPHRWLFGITLKQPFSGVASLSAMLTVTRFGGSIGQ